MNKQIELLPLPGQTKINLGIRTTKGLPIELKTSDDGYTILQFPAMGHIHYVEGGKRVKFRTLPISNTVPSKDRYQLSVGTPTDNGQDTSVTLKFIPTDTSADYREQEIKIWNRDPGTSRTFRECNVVNETLPRRAGRLVSEEYKHIRQHREQSYFAFRPLQLTVSDERNSTK